MFTYSKVEEKNLLKEINELKSVKYNDHLDRTIQDSYTINFDHPVVYYLKLILPFVFPPLALYYLFHILFGKLGTTKKTYRKMFGFDTKGEAKEKTSNIDKKWHIKRFFVYCDGYRIEAAVMTSEKTRFNGKWMLYSNGNLENFDERIKNPATEELIDELETNVLFFNYPGHGKSSGMPTVYGMVKAYKAMLTLLENEEPFGFAAKQIIGYGYSLGGAVQGQALSDHQLKQGIEYLFIKDRTFADMGTIASERIQKFSKDIIKNTTKLIGWNISSLVGSLNAKAPEVILQSAHVDQYIEITNSPELIKHDQVLPEESTLAYNLVQAKKDGIEDKIIIGIPENHGDQLKNPRYLARKIKSIIIEEDHIEIELEKAA